MLFLVCSPAPDIDNGIKSILNQIVVNETLTLELKVGYSCDFGRTLVPQDHEIWTCIFADTWSFKNNTRCLLGIFCTTTCLRNNSSQVSNDSFA